MSYRTILAVLQGNEDTARVLACALPLATRFSAHLIGTHAEAMPMPYVSPMGFADTQLLASDLEAMRERSQKIEEIFEAGAAREGVSHAWRALDSFSGDSALGALAVARACDLIIAQQTDPEVSATANLDALLFDSGRPVLFVPYAINVEPSFRKVLIAWNGTQQAARAVFDALPFITAADAVEILAVDAPDTAQQDSAVAGADIAASLARHGARVTFTSRASGGIGAGEAIENRISETAADLLVMGAYSQSWLKEFFFGGATRTLLRSMATATLMSR